MRLISQEIFYKSPGVGTLVYGNSFYTRGRGGEKICRRALETRSDLMDSIEQGFSSDNGRTWSPLETLPVVRTTPRGTYRLTLQPGYVDPVNGRLITMLIEGVSRGRRSSLIEVRLDFVNEILRSADDI